MLVPIDVWKNKQAYAEKKKVDVKSSLQKLEESRDGGQIALRGY